MKFYKKHFLKLLDFTPEEIGALIDFAADLKAQKKADLPRGKVSLVDYQVAFIA